MSKLANTIRRLAEETSGTELMEAAAIFPLMFMVFFGIFWFGQAFSMYGTITRAAQEGARAAAAPYCTTCATTNLPPANARAAVQASLTTTNLNVTNAQWPSPAPTLLQCNGTTPVSCDGPTANVCVQQPVQLTTPTTGVSGVCGVAVSFQYPFQFWLPFSSLNKQQIWLKAQARVRIETQ